MRRLVLLLTILACLAVPAALAKGSFPETIPLPNGFAARGDRDRQGRHVLRRLHSHRRGLRAAASAPGQATSSCPARRSRGDRAQVRPRPAVGLRRRDRKGVCLQRPKTGALSNELQLATSAGPTFINDVVVTEAAAYFTDSNRAVSTRSRVVDTAPRSRDPDLTDRRLSSTSPGST